MKSYKVQCTPTELVMPYIMEQYFLELQTVTHNIFCFAHHPSTFELFQKETVQRYEDLSKLKNLSPVHHTLYVYLLNLRNMFHSGLKQYFLNKQSNLFDLKRYCREGLVLVHKLMGCN